MGAVAVGLVGDMGDEDELGVRHLLDEFFGDAELGRVNEVVGGVDVHDRNGDAVEVRARVVVARGVTSVVDEVVGVVCGVHAGRGAVVDELLWRPSRGGRGLLLHERSGAHDEEHFLVRR